MKIVVRIVKDWVASVSILIIYDYTRRAIQDCAATLRKLLTRLKAGERLPSHHGRIGGVFGRLQSLHGMEEAELRWLFN
jgi:hypothetical protein